MTTAIIRIGYLAHVIRQGNHEDAAPIAAGLHQALSEWEGYQ